MADYVRYFTFTDTRTVQVFEWLLGDHRQEVGEMMLVAKEKAAHAPQKKDDKWAYSDAVTDALAPQLEEFVRKWARENYPWLNEDAMFDDLATYFVLQALNECDYHRIALAVFHDVIPFSDPTFDQDDEGLGDDDDGNEEGDEPGGPTP